MQAFSPSLFLCDFNRVLVSAWELAFENLPEVTVRCGSIFSISTDALVSPANSFGYMDGGIDLVISQQLGLGVQRRLQALIQERHHGELLVGSAEIVPTEHLQFPYVISAPTMRVPMILGSETVNPYLATRAVLNLIKHGVDSAGRPIRSFVKTVALCGMGTGVGEVPPEICARQMRTAYDEVVLGRGRFPSSWHDAQASHQRLYTDSVRDLQRRE